MADVPPEWLCDFPVRGIDAQGEFRHDCLRLLVKVGDGYECDRGHWSPTLAQDGTDSWLGRGRPWTSC